MIENAKREDKAELKRLAAAAILTSVSAADDEKVEIIALTDQHIDQLVDVESSLFLKYSNTQGEILGFILLQDLWNLASLYVHPEHHEKGIGQALFNEAKTLALANGYKGAIRVNSSINAEGFYRRLGFEDFKPQNPGPGFVVPLSYNIT